MKTFNLQTTQNRIMSILVMLMFVLHIAACPAQSPRLNPFVKGKVPTDYFDMPKSDDSPVHSMVFYPTTPGLYPLLFFVPGFRGMLPSSMHTTYLQGVASHGFVVVSTDHMAMDSFDVRVKNFMAQFEMVKTGLNGMLSKRANGTVANMNNITYGSHSAGAEVTIAMLKENHDEIKATVFLEPMVMYLNETIPFDLPAVMFGTRYSEESSSLLFPPCVFPDYDFRHVYTNWVAPKLQMEAKYYGHCDIMDKEGRDICGSLHLCKMNQTADLTSYQLYVQGLTTGFLEWVLYGVNNIDYLTDASYAPISLMNLKYQKTVLQK